MYDYKMFQKKKNSHSWLVTLKQIHALGMCRKLTKFGNVDNKVAYAMIEKKRKIKYLYDY